MIDDVAVPICKESNALQSPPILLAGSVNLIEHLKRRKKKAVFHHPNEKYSLVREEGWPCWYSTKPRLGTATSPDVMQWCDKIFPDWLPQENTFANNFIVRNLSCIIRDCVGDTEIRQGMSPGWALPTQDSFACQVSSLHFVVPSPIPPGQVHAVPSPTHTLSVP